MRCSRSRKREVQHVPGLKRHLQLTKLAKSTHPEHCPSLLSSPDSSCAPPAPTPHSFSTLAPPLQALKLVAHIGRRGGTELRRLMARHSGAVRELLHYRCEPDPFKGDTVWKRVQVGAGAQRGAPLPSAGGLLLLCSAVLPACLQSLAALAQEPACAALGEPPLQSSAAVCASCCRSMPRRRLRRCTAQASRREPPPAAAWAAATLWG